MERTAMMRKPDPPATFRSSRDAKRAEISGVNRGQLTVFLMVVFVCMPAAVTYRQFFMLNMSGVKRSNYDVDNGFAPPVIKRKRKKSNYAVKKNKEGVKVEEKGMKSRRKENRKRVRVEEKLIKPPKETGVERHSKLEMQNKKNHQKVTPDFSNGMKSRRKENRKRVRVEEKLIKPPKETGVKKKSKLEKQNKKNHQKVTPDFSNGMKSRRKENRKRVRVEEKLIKPPKETGVKKKSKLEKQNKKKHQKVTPDFSNDSLKGNEGKIDASNSSTTEDGEQPKDAGGDVSDNSQKDNKANIDGSNSSTTEGGEQPKDAGGDVSDNSQKDNKANIDGSNSSTTEGGEQPKDAGGDVSDNSQKDNKANIDGSNSSTTEGGEQPKDAGGDVSDNSQKDNKANIDGSNILTVENGEQPKDAGGGVSRNSQMDSEANIDDSKITNETDSGGSNNFQQKDGDRPPLNIVIFFPDDMNHRSLQDVSGTGYVKTPFLTELARDGIRFAKNAVTTSICWMSRATLFTGQYTSSHGSMQLKCPRFTLPQYWNDTWVATLQRLGGYYVGHVGKWQYMKNAKLPHYFNFSNFFEGSHWYSHQRQPMSASDKSVMHAIEFLQERPKDTPFALTVAYYPPKAVGGSKEPGGQWFPKESSKALYANTTYEPPYDVEKAHADLPDFLKKKIMRNRYLERWDTTEKYNTGMRNYHALVTEVDLASSQIVEELKRQGLYENTMIIFTSDNGLMMGSHGLGGKWIAYEESIRVPLIIYDPRMPSEKRGSVDNSMTLNIDLASTILGAANIAPPEAMQGRDIADLYLSSNDGTSKLKEKPWRTEYLYEYPIWSLSQNSLIGERYKYIHWMGFQSEQLFDIQEDPFELNDLIKQVSKDEAEVDSNHIAQMEKLAVGLFETLHGVKVTISELHDLLKEKGIAVGQNKSESEEATLKELIEALISELKIRYENVRNEVQGPGGKPDWCDPSLEYP